MHDFLLWKGLNHQRNAECKKGEGLYKTIKRKVYYNGGIEIKGEIVREGEDKYCLNNLQPFICPNFNSSIRHNLVSIHHCIIPWYLEILCPAKFMKGWTSERGEEGTFLISFIIECKWLLGNSALRRKIWLILLVPGNPLSFWLHGWVSTHNLFLLTMLQSFTKNSWN